MRIGFMKQHWKAHAFQSFVFGPAILLDGIISTLTLSFIKTDFALDTAKTLSRIRLNNQRKGETK